MNKKNLKIYFTTFVLIATGAFLVFSYFQNVTKVNELIEVFPSQTKKVYLINHPENLQDTSINRTLYLAEDTTLLKITNTLQFLLKEDIKVQKAALGIINQKELFLVQSNKEVFEQLKQKLSKKGAFQKIESPNFYYSYQISNIGEILIFYRKNQLSPSEIEAYFSSDSTLAKNSLFKKLQKTVSKKSTVNVINVKSAHPFVLADENQAPSSFDINFKKNKVIGNGMIFNQEINDTYFKPSLHPSKFSKDTLITLTSTNKAGNLLSDASLIDSSSVFGIKYKNASTNFALNPNEHFYHQWQKNYASREDVLVNFVYHIADSFPFTQPASEVVEINSWEIINHRTQSYQKLTENSLNQLSLIDKEDTIWTKKINSEIKGNVKQIDLYNNNKLQLIFATQNSLELLDILGNNLTGFPSTIKQNITLGVFPMDYDNNRKYRLLVVAGNQILNYATDGKPVTGWNIARSESPFMVKLKHEVIQTKDYIITFNEAGKLYFLNRKGEERYQASKTVPNAKQVVDFEIIIGPSIQLSKIKLFYEDGSQLELSLS